MTRCVGAFIGSAFSGRRPKPPQEQGPRSTMFRGSFEVFEGPRRTYPEQAKERGRRLAAPLLQRHPGADLGCLLEPFSREVERPSERIAAGFPQNNCGYRGAPSLSGSISARYFCAPCWLRSLDQTEDGLNRPIGRTRHLGGRISGDIQRLPRERLVRPWCST